jgi:hypothetical protein
VRDQCLLLAQDPEVTLVHQLLTGRCEHDAMDEDEESGFPSLVSVIAVCGFVLLTALTAPLWVAPAKNWLLPLNRLPEAPSVEKGGTQTPQEPAAAWTNDEIQTALMQCVQALAPITADVVPLAPIRSGDCGVAAPVLVNSIGGRERVSFDPPLVLTCAMVGGLDRWLTESVQPAAREAFSSPVSKIIGSSYACRHVYNLPNGNLSQHAFANAVDLPIFVLADGRKVNVTHGWGSTQRDLIAVAKAKKTAAGVTGSVGQKKKEKSSKGSVSDVVKISATPSGTTNANQSAASAVDPKAVAEGKFLRRAHDGGCKIFSTVMGPEANEVHRTHLHLDLQDRTTTVCE